MGSTMASTAILSYEPDVHLIDLISQIGQRSAVRAYRAGIEALDSLEQTIKTLDDSCDFRRRESLFSQQSQAFPDCAPRIEALDWLEQMIKTLDDSCDFRRRESLCLASNRKHAGDCAPRMRDQAEAQFRG